MKRRGHRYPRRLREAYQDKLLIRCRPRLAESLREVAARGAAAADGLRVIGSGLKLLSRKEVHDGKV